MFKGLCFKLDVLFYFYFVFKFVVKEMGVWEDVFVFVMEEIVFIVVVEVLLFVFEELFVG